MTGLYFCPAAREVESATRGGFDTCCDRPDLHLPMPDSPATAAVSEALSDARKTRSRLSRVRRYCELTADSCRVQAAETARDVLDLLDGGAPDAAGQSRTIPDSGQPTKACQGFQWIGQPFYCCDRCGRPAWEHQGMHTFDRSKGLFGDREGHVEPWKPGEADKIRARWEPAWHEAAGCGGSMPGTLRHGPDCPDPDLLDAKECGQ